VRESPVRVLPGALLRFAAQLLRPSCEQRDEQSSLAADWTVWSGNCCDHRVAESNTERRRSRDRRQRDRRERRIEHLQAELEPLRASVKATEESIRELEREQRTQLVRIAQMQQELIELKKSKR